MATSEPGAVPDQSHAGQPGAAELLQLVVDTPSVEAYLAEMATMAGALTPAIAGVGVTMRRGTELMTVATSDPLAAAVDEVQYGLGMGPCLDSIEAGDVITVHDMVAEDRWDGYSGHALSHGVRSSLSVPLTVSGTTIGALNCYGREPGMFVDQLRDQVVEFGTHAELALAVALKAAQQSELVEQLHTAMQSRSLIDQAMGILMARQRCTAQEAFAILRSASQSRNRKIVDIAADLVSMTTGHLPQPGRFQS